MGTAAMQQKCITTLQRLDPVQTPQPVAAPGSAASMAPIQQLLRFHWSHALLAVGVIAASGAGTALLFKKMVIHRLKAWIQKVVASAAAFVAKASQVLLSTKEKERKYFEAFMGALDIQVKEMKSMGDRHYS